MNNVIPATSIKGKFKVDEVLIPRVPIISTDLPFQFQRKLFQFPARSRISMYFAPVCCKNDAPEMLTFFDLLYLGYIRFDLSFGRRSGNRFSSALRDACWLNTQYLNTIWGRVICRK